MKERFSSFFKDIMDILNEGVMVVGKDGKIVMANEAMLKISGFSADELNGTACTVLNCDACKLLRRESKQHWCGLFENEMVQNKPCTFVKKDGSLVSVIKNALTMKDRNGQITGALEIFNDVTELERKDLKIQELTQKLCREAGFCEMVGSSRAMQQIFHVTEKAAQNDTTILISGESGTGKELVAHAIHDLGRRHDGPFVKINCAALNESLIESELFGHKKGAFTGAIHHRKGLFETADNGDLFLDEIGDIPVSTQVKLLRVLESKQFQRIGDNTPVSVDVRIITATNRDLRELVAQGTFREDLFYRINVFPIHLPPLRERKEDIALLVDSFLQKLSTNPNIRTLTVSPEVMDLFMTYDWPGNVRELRSILEYAAVICDSHLIETRHLPVTFQGLPPSQDGHNEPVATHLTAKDQKEKLALIQALKASDGNQSQAAKILNVHRMTIRNRMHKYGIRLRHTL